MSEVIKKSDISEKDIYGYVIESAKKAEEQVALLNQELRESAKLNNATIKKNQNLATISEIKATEYAIKLSNVQLKEQLKLENDLIKIQADRINAEIKLKTATERSTKATEKEINAQERSISVYSRVDKWLASLVKEYRELAIKKELNGKLTTEEINRMETLSGRITKYDNALKAVDATTGKHQRNVGNYKSAYNGLGNSINQLTREMPAFANSVQTGFMAISNNLPMFFDEITKLKNANIELTKSGEPTKSIFKSLGAAIFSFGTLLSVGVTLLTLYGKEMVNFVSEIFKGKTAIDKNKFALEAYNASLEAYKTATASATAKVKEMAVNFELAKEGVISKKEALKIYNETLGTSLGFAKDYNEAEQIFIKKSEAYIKAFALRAQAQELYSKAGEERAKGLTAKMDDNVSMIDKISTSFKLLFGDVTSGYDDIKEAQKEGTQDAIKDSKTKEKIYTDEADMLFRQAELLSKMFNIEVDGSEKTKNVKVKNNKIKIASDQEQLKVLISALNLTIEYNRELAQMNELLSKTQKIKFADIEKSDQDVRNRKKAIAQIHVLDAELSKNQKAIRRAKINQIMEDLDAELENIELSNAQREVLEKEAQLKIAEIEKEALMERFETSKKFIDLSLDYFIKQSEKKIAQIDKEISASEKQSEILEQLAINGNITAQQSLVVQQQITQKANNEKIKEQKRIENLKALEQAYNIYGTNLEKTGDPKQALINTISDIEALKLLLSVLPSYKDGIEDTGAQGKGVDGIGGFHAILHPNERVVNEENNQKMKGISNDDLGNLAQSYKNGQVINLKKQDHAGNSFDIAPLLSEMRGLKKAIEDKPTTDIKLGEIYQHVFEIIETRKSGNKTERNIFNIRS